MLGDTFQNCDQACSSRGSHLCSATHLQLLNSCDSLREVVACEAGCESSKKLDGGAPGYIDAGAAKSARPAMCFVHQAGTNVTCGAQESSMKRLCACKK